ncbi:MAG: endonuclease III [Archaeoglobus sp.]|nr:endonuclease III [Archaeoglobus sp.]
MIPKKSLDWEKLLDLMESEARKRNAPVFTLKGFLNEPFQHLVFAILSARTRDEQTVRAASNLYKVADTPEKLARLSEEEIASLIKAAGFYKNKAKNLKAMAKILVEEHGSRVPDSYEELVKLPGVGRKTANVVLTHAFNKSTIAVDTHVHRIANRLGLVRTEKPEETEEELKKIVPKELWKRVNTAFVAFGQTVCRPIKPLCSECPVEEFCQKVGV